MSEHQTRTLAAADIQQAKEPPAGRGLFYSRPIFAQGSAHNTRRFP